MNTDIDFLVEIPKNKWEPVETLLNEHGFNADDDEFYDTSDFTSYRQGNINLIVTADPTFAGLFRVATELCKERNVMNRNERVRVFQSILYGKK